MKSLEIKKVGIGSVFKLSFTIGVIIGLIAGVIFLITGSLVQNIGLQLGTTHFDTGGPLQIGASVLGIVIGSLAYGLANSVIGIIGALIYNIFAAIVGGIVLKVEQ
jgi:hypothetical protein